jgi:hypothetical protein
VFKREIKHLYSSRLGNDESRRGLSAGLTLSFNSLDNVQTFNDFSEDDVLAIQPRGEDSGDEELRSVGVRTSVGHGEKTNLGVLQLEVFVFKLVTVDALSSSSVSSSEVTSLEHELRNDSVE